MQKICTRFNVHEWWGNPRANVLFGAGFDLAALVIWPVINCGIKPTGLLCGND